MTSFTTAIAATLLVLYTPGLLGLGLAKKPAAFGICFAPLVSIALYEIIAITLSLLGIATNITIVLGFATALAAIVGAILRKLSQGENKFEFPIAILALTAAFSFAFSWLVFFRPLGYETIISGYDTVYHVNLIQAFIDSGYYSPLNTSLYSGSAASPVNSSAGFYPAAWHLICATVRECTNIDPAIVINAVNCTFCSTCFACGQIILFSRLIKVEKSELALLAFLPLLSTAFPWAQLAQGEQFPQIASFCLLPLACALFDILLERKGRDATVLLCSLGALLTLSTTQTNMVFSLAVFVFFDAFRYIKVFSKPKNKKMNYIAFALASIALWSAAYFSPVLSGVVSYEWESTYSVFGAIAKVCTLSLAVSGTQLIMALLALGGLIWILHNKKYAWVLCLFVFTSAVFVAGTSLSGFPKHFLAGFWYTDPIRLGAQVSIFVFPLIACGTLWIVRTLNSKFPNNNNAVVALKITTPALVVILAVLIVHVPFVNGGNTPFGTIRKSIDSYNNEAYEPILSKTELEFSNKANELIEEDSVVLNVPDDGSGILYGELGMNVYCKRTYSLEDECDDAKTLREGLANIANDVNVKNTARDLNVKYLLLLDADRSSGLYHTFRSDNRWESVYSINENTPGFELLLSEDDCRLYRIIT